MKKRRLFSVDAILIMALAVLFASCMIGDDEKKQEIVEDPLANLEQYYISGRILDKSGNALEGVAVALSNGISGKTDMTGLFMLKVNAKGTYKLNLEKTGYLGLEVDASFDANAENRSSMTFSIVMSKFSQAVIVTGKENEPVRISDDVRATTYVEIMPGSVSKSTPIAVTAFTELISPIIVSGNKQIITALETTYFEPTGTNFNNSVVLSVNNSVNTNIYFEDLGLAYKESETSNWGMLDTKVHFNQETNRYETEIDHFSSYAVTLRAEKIVSAENMSEINIELKKDNTGNMEAIRDFKIEFNEAAGWNFTENLDTSIKNALSGISGSDLTGMATMIQNCVISIESGKPGFYKIPHSLTTNISGNYIMYYSNRAKYCNTQYKFKVNYKNSSKTITVKVKRYTGMKETYTNQDASKHSGGGGA